MDGRKGTPDWLVDEGVELQPQPGLTGLAEVSFWRQRGTPAGFQDKHLASSALEIIGTLHPDAPVPGSLSACTPHPPACFVLTFMGLWGHFSSPLLNAYAPTGFSSFLVYPSFLRVALAATCEEGLAPPSS